MKKWAVLFVFAASSAMACPDLSGKYAGCLSESGGAVVDQIAIEQTQTPNAHVFKIMSEPSDGAVETFIADGQTYTTTGEGYSQKQVAQCIGNELVVSSSVSIGKDLVSEMTIRISKSGSQLVQHLNSESMMNGKYEDTVTCESNSTP